MKRSHWGLLLLAVGAGTLGCAPGPCPEGWERLEDNLCAWAGGPPDGGEADDDDTASGTTFLGDLALDVGPTLDGFCGSFDRIDGSLTVYASGLSSLGALDCLTEITGDVSISSNQELAAVVLPALVRVGGALYVNANGALAVLDLPALTEVGDNLAVDLNPALAGLAMTALARVGGAISIYQNAAFEPVAAGEASLRGLVEVDGNVFIRLNNAMTRVDLAGLTRVGGMLKITGNRVLTELSAPLLAETNGLWLSYNDSLQSFSLPELRSTAGVTLIRPGPTTLDLPRLRTASATIEVFDTATMPTLRMPALEEIAGDLRIHDNPGVTALEFPALRSIEGGLEVVRNPVLPTTEAEALRDSVGTQNIAGGVEISGNAGG